MFVSVATWALCYPILELLFSERGCLRFSTSNNSLKSSFLHNCILWGGGEETNSLHIFKWKLESRIFKYGIHLHLTTKSRNLSFTLYREIFSFLKKPVLRVFESLPKRDLVDSENHLVQSVTLFNEFFFFTILFHSQTYLHQNNYILGHLITFWHLKYIW